MLRNSLITWIKTKFKNYSIPLIYALGSYFLLVYGYINYYTSKLENVPSFYFPWEIKIPFIPWMIVPYMSSDIIFVISFLLPWNKSEVLLLAKRIGFLITFSAICYFIYPLKFHFIRSSTADSVYSSVFSILSLDLPFNQCPSLHISQGFIFWIVFLNHFKGRFARLCIHAWFVLIYISTLTVFQHHFIDILGGQLLALLSFVLFPNTSEKNYRNERFAYFYYMVSCLWFSASFFTHIGWSILLIYFSFTYLLVGISYHFHKHDLLIKKDGQHIIPIKLFFGHYLFCTWIEWIIHSQKRGKKYAEVLPHLYFGIRPKSLQESPVTDEGVWGIIDLAPEISELEALLKHNYHYYPLNDMSYPSFEWLQQVADKIDELLLDNYDVYVHCRLGRTRSALVICAYLIFKKNYTQDEAFSYISSLKKIQLKEDFNSTFKS